MLHYKSEENHNGVNTQCHKNEIIIFRFVSICISVNGAEGEGNKIVIKKKLHRTTTNLKYLFWLYFSQIVFYW